MIGQVTTLTIDIEVTSTNDVSKKNDVYNIRNSDLLKDEIIAASSWISFSTCRNEARSKILRLIFKQAMNKTPKYNFWCFIGNSTWQDDTRIVRHRKLWKALHARGIDISHCMDSHEEVIEGDGKLRFFGAKLFSELSIKSVISAIEEERCSYLVFLPESISLEPALLKGWNVYNGFDEDLLKFTLDNEGVIFKAVGEYDDPDSGFVGLGSPRLISILA